MKIKDPIIEDFHYCANTDAFLVLARRGPGGNQIRRYLVGWIARATPDVMLEPHFFMDSDSAHKAFENTRNTEDRPVELLDADDAQQQAVYDWEDRCVFSGNEIPLRTPEEAKTLMRKVSRAYKIPCPRLHWGKAGNTSEYHSDENAVYFHHRSVPDLLHEMAHAIHFQHEGDNCGQNHGPAFVWIALELYNRYAGIDLPFLVQSAATRGILGYLGGPPPWETATKPKDSAAPLPQPRP